MWINEIQGLTEKQKIGMKLEYACSVALTKLVIEHEHHSWNRDYAMQENHGPDVWSNKNRPFVIECKNWNEWYRKKFLSPYLLKRDYLARLPIYVPYPSGLPTQRKYKRIIIVSVKPKVTKQTWWLMDNKYPYRIHKFIDLGFFVDSDEDISRAIHVLCRKLAFLRPKN